MLYRQESEDSIGAFTLGGAFSGKRPNNKPLDIIRVAASGSWFQELGIMTNLGAPEERFAQKFPAPSGSLEETHQLAVELRNNKVSFFMDNVLLNETQVAGWEIDNGSKITMPTVAPAVSATTADAPLQQPALKVQADKSRQWSPEQATGAPDTNKAGDLPTAWASLNPDAGPEWLQVEFAKPTEIAEVRIRETFNPGAITKVEAISADNKGTVIWEGTAEAKPAPSDMVVKPQSAVVSNKIKIHLDTTRVPGWNEIDAVELLGKDGSRQWAQAATASTTFADAQPQRPAPKIQQAAQPQQYNLQELIGENLVDAEGKPVDPISLKGKMVGIYFSAQWCPPCRLFTPKLVEFRNKIAKDFEVVFVSSDRDEASMQAYMKEAGMPWPALPFGLEKKTALSKTFEIRGIPSLVVLNDKGIRISGNSRNDVASLEPEAALEKWKKNEGILTKTPPTTNIANQPGVILADIPFYEGDKISPPKDLIIDPGKSIFGCPYGSTEEEVIKKLGQPIGKIQEKDKISTLYYGSDCALIFQDRRLCGVDFQNFHLQGLFGYERNQGNLIFASAKIDYEKKQFSGGWRLTNGVHPGMDFKEAKKICGITSLTNPGWQNQFELNGQAITIGSLDWDGDTYVYNMKMIPSAIKNDVENIYKSPFNIPCKPSQSIFGCKLGSDRLSIIKQLGEPDVELKLGKNKEGMLYQLGNKLDDKYEAILLLWDGKLGGGRFRGGWRGNAVFPYQDIIREIKTTYNIVPFYLDNGIGLNQPFAYAAGILGKRLINGNQYIDGPSVITFTENSYGTDDQGIPKNGIQNSVVREIKIEPLDKLKK
jgi:thiol-disulfide isomerase/thioredoxin